MKNFLIIIAIVVSFGGIYFAINSGKVESENNTTSGISIEQNTDSKTQNVYMEGGKQIIEISVRGGYNPRQSEAKSGIPTILRFKTNNTFDCSSSISVPSLKISEYLPSTGVKDFDIGTPAAQKLKGTCSMGMYQFVINFN